MAAIYFHPEAYTTAGPKLMGRNAAGESFLRGFLSYAATQELLVYVQKLEHAEQFAKIASSYNCEKPVKAISNANTAALSAAKVMYYPGPGIGNQALRRSLFGHGAWSLCGITHTTSSATAMDEIASLITQPTQAWDALICTSNAVKDNVLTVLQTQADYLANRFGLKSVPVPMLPVIPLGIHTQDFLFNEKQKQLARAGIGANENSIIVLFMGRLSFHAKAHPLAMYQALELAAKALNYSKEIILVECGWFANSFIENAYKEAAMLACPNVRVVTLDGRNQDSKHMAWACADIFCSLSDNIQETFGIAPIEAMAAGLPVVVSDWDGYKDTVRDCIDGFRIPSIMPIEGLGVDLAFRHTFGIDTYDMYCGHCCSFVCIDVQAASRAFIELFKSPQLRAEMGKSGRQRAVSMYDWKSIIIQYETLWAEQDAVRQSSVNGQDSLKHPWPARLDPFYSFKSYPTNVLSPNTLLKLTDADLECAIKRYLSYVTLSMVAYANDLLPQEVEVRAILSSIAIEPKSAANMVSFAEPNRQAFLFRSLLWLLKLNILKICD